jgi:hypothetical protein
VESSIREMRLGVPQIGRGRRGDAAAEGSPQERVGAEPTLTFLATAIWARSLPIGAWARSVTTVVTVRAQIAAWLAASQFLSRTPFQSELAKPVMSRTVAA